MLLKNKLFKSTLSILLVLLLTIACMPISVSATETDTTLDVKSIEVEPISIMEYTTGCYDYTYNPETDEYDLEYFYYWPEDIMEYTITLNDGTTITDVSYNFYYNDEWYYFDYETNQSYENQWTAGNTYTMTVSLGGVSVDVPVTITDSPFKSIEIEPISIMESTNGNYAEEYNPETYEYDLEYFQYHPEDIMEYTITLNDGATITGTGYEFNYNDEWYYLDFNTDQEYKNRWSVGNTYTMKVSLGNLTVDVPVTITELPFVSIDVEPITLFEKYDGYYTNEYNPEIGDYYLEYFEYAPATKMKYTVTLNDGSTFNENCDYFYYNSETICLGVKTNQSYKNQWLAGNTYTITVSLGSISVDVPVTITESPFKSIDIKPISITEGSNGSYNYDYNPETDDYDLEYFLYYPEDIMEYTVTLNDGETITGTGFNFNYNDELYYFDYETNQSYENQWTAGNTYTMTVSLNNLTVDVPVTITEQPFVSIDVKPITLYEKLDGYYTNEYNPETDESDSEYFEYDPMSKINYTITLNDGTTIEGDDFSFYYNDDEYYLEYNTNQSYDNQWTAGNTYTITVSLNGISVDVPVTIAESPFKSIEFEPITIIENTTGFYVSEYNPETDEREPEYYNYYPELRMKYTVTLNDGTTISGMGISFKYDNAVYTFDDWSTDQSYENQWTVGNTYTATVKFGDLTVDVPVTITENPFESLEIKPISIEEFTNGDYNYDYIYDEDDFTPEYYYYYPEELIEYTITLNDGSKISGTGYNFDYNGYTYNFNIKEDQSYENQWTAGNTYTMTVSISTTTVDVPVTITSSKPAPTLKGDVDCDGFITIKDATMAQEHVARLNTLTGDSALNADVDGSGDINIVDATYIQMYVAKQISSFDNI